MADEPRPYRKRKRAELEAQTRLRLTEAAMELHGTLGPARTSLSAIAARAGVRRSTLYRHFADEAAVFAACNEHWMARNPLPDLDAWAAVEDPALRLKTALTELYAFYAGNEQMVANLLRDESAVPILAQLMEEWHGYLAAGRDVLLEGRLAGADRAATRRLRAAVGHALAFPTWRSLAREQGLRDAEAVELMRRAVEAVARPAS